MGRTSVVVVTVVEEIATDGVTMPTDGAVGVLGSPEVGIGAVVNHGVVRYGHLGRVVGGDVDVVGSIGQRLLVILVMDKATELDSDVSDIARGIEVGLDERVGSVDNLSGDADGQKSTERADIKAICARDVGEAGQGLRAGLLSIVVVTQIELEVGREVLLTHIADGVGLTVLSRAMETSWRS